MAEAAHAQPLVDFVAWGRWVRTRPIAAAVLVGIIATQIASISGYFMNVIGLPQLNWNRVNGTLVLPDGSPGAQWWAGAFVHHINGVVFTVLFVALLWHRIPLPVTPNGSLLKGLIHGWILALISVALLVPYVYFSKVGLDPFGFGIPFPLQQSNSAGSGPLYADIGWKLPFAVVVWHTAYGATVGAMLHPSD